MEPNCGTRMDMPSRRCGSPLCLAAVVPKHIFVSQALKGAPDVPLLRRLQEACFARVFPLWLCGSHSSLLVLVPHITAQQTRGPSRASPALGQRREEQEGVFPCCIASAASSKGRDGALVQPGTMGGPDCSSSQAVPRCCSACFVSCISLGA